MKKSVLFFNESLDGGGAEGILENIVKSIDKNQFEASVVSETDHEFRTEAIKANSRYHCFIHKNINNSKMRSIINKIIIKFSLLASENAVRKVLIRGKYDIEVAFCEGYSTKIIGNSAKKGCKKVAWVHTDVVNNPWSVSIHGSEEAERKCYENFDAIVCVSETIRDSFIKKYGMSEKVHLIYNVIDSDKILSRASEPIDLSSYPRPLFLLCGSFRKVKGYDRMVRVCSKLKDEGYDFSAIIMGIGYERDDIEKLLDEYNMRDRITLMEFQKNPYSYMKNSSAYVCSSRAEGYSTVVAESVLLGLPVITTECSGMREIFGDSECGIICDNSEEGLYGALKKILDNPVLLEHYTSEEMKRGESFITKERIKIVENFLKEL